MKSGEEVNSMMRYRRVNHVKVTESHGFFAEIVIDIGRHAKFRRTSSIAPPSQASMIVMR
jgi:hypothetical protein